MLIQKYRVKNVAKNIELIIAFIKEPWFLELVSHLEKEDFLIIKNTDISLHTTILMIKLFKVKYFLNGLSL